MPIFGLQLRATGPRGSFERWYERPPVFVGRRPTSDCILDTQGVSKTHACIDLRARAICVRDCGSANGTLVGGVVAEPHRWTRAGSLGEIVEIRISEWTLQIAALPVADAPANTGTAMLTEMFEPQALRGGGGAGVDPRAQASAQAAQAQTVILSDHPGKGFAAPAPLPLDAAHADLLRAQRTLYEATSRLLAGAPVPNLRGLCEQLVATYPLMATEQGFVALLRHYGWSPAHGQEGTSLASSALDRMQELVRWYLGPERSIANEAELVAFKEHQRRALDELLIGFVRLLSGLDKFEQQMALKQDNGAGGAPRSPAELVRQLLDWRLPAEEALQDVRASFADLMMHQVALLQGVMRGVKALLTELAPATIESIARERKKGILPFGGPDPWAIYKERHADFSDEENERFRVMFGADFAEEYRILTGEARKGDSQGPPQGPASPSRRP